MKEKHSILKKIKLKGEVDLNLEGDLNHNLVHHKKIFTNFKARSKFYVKKLLSTILNLDQKYQLSLIGQRNRLKKLSRSIWMTK
jgi:hypothetical protein